MINRITFININSKLELGSKLFLIGVLFLPSALPISVFFLLPSLIIGFLKRDSYILRDKWNYPLFVSIGIILFSTLNISFINRDMALSNYDISLMWINLFNWIPVFFLFWGFQVYLKTVNQRIIFAKFLLIGTIPVIVSFVLQSWFRLYGPFKTFFDLIVWYQKPQIDRFSPVTGLFSNPNYASMWLILILPFTFFLVNKYKGFTFKKSFSCFLSLSLIFCIFFTQSRNGILGIAIISLLIMGYKKFFLFSLGFIGFLSAPRVYEYFMQITGINFISFVNKFFVDFSNDGPRVEIWKSAISRIKERPLFGWGGSTFSFLSDLQSQTLDLKPQHTHNIFLEISHNFGLLVAILLSITILLMVLKTWIIIYSQNHFKRELLLEKAWLTSIIIFLFTHLSDITFYDGKISILVAILFSGLKCILENEKNLKINKSFS